MNFAILVVGTIAAFAGVAGVAIQLRQQRRRLDIKFTGSWSASAGSIDFGIRVANASQVPIYDVEVFAGPPGLLLDQRHLVGKVTLPPVASHDYNVVVPRPSAVEIEAGEQAPTLATPWLVIARYDKRLDVIEHPSGPFSSEAGVRVGKHKLKP